VTSLAPLLLKLCRREDLTRDEAADVFGRIMDGGCDAAQVGGLLVGMAAKGSSVDELVGAAVAMRERVVPIETSGLGVVLDTCGTGGSPARAGGLFNISTAAALIAAAAGVKVVKHGNRSASSRSGSADVLEALGVRLERSGDELRDCLDRCNLCFAFARSHHPAMRHVAAVRSALAIPTIFNLLGPLTNPGRASRQLLGVFAPELTDRLAAVLRDLGSERAWIVHAADGLDELSIAAITQVTELRDGRLRRFDVVPADYGLDGALADLRVSGPAESAATIRDIAAGVQGPRRDIAALNAAAALVVAGQCETLRDGLVIARAAIDSGAMRGVLDQLVAA
jgi:anthranilate phosphoribosyltransferase